MPRRIIALANEESETEGQEMPQSSTQGEAILPDATKAVSGECVITQEEMENLLNEWTLMGQGDLIVNPTMADRLKQYIAYQEELDPLREQLAKRLYEKFSCEFERASDWVERNVYVNGEKEGYYVIISSRTQNDSKVYVKLHDFKKILASIGNPYAKYIPEDDKSTRVNIFAFLKSIGASINDDYNGLEITINQ